MFNGHTHGQPWVVHDRSGRSAVLSNLDNFFVSGFAYDNTTVSSPTIDVGLRNTLKSIPPNFQHKSVLVVGNGINRTMMTWGDILLAGGGANKARSNVYDDFLLAHMGYFTDNGAEDSAPRGRRLLLCVLNTSHVALSFDFLPFLYILSY